MLDFPVTETTPLLVNQTYLCPCERALRDVAGLYRERDALPEDDGHVGRHVALKYLHDQIAIGEAWAARSLALTPVGAAFQALLLFQHSGFGLLDTPQTLTTDERAAVFETSKGVRATGLSLYRLLSRGIEDADLKVVHRVTCGSETYGEMFESIGVDVLKNL